jgi:hypothetical protein
MDHHTVTKKVVSVFVRFGTPLQVIKNMVKVQQSFFIKQSAM